ncbi:MAG: histidine kinase [Bacteroidota bacterium]
MLSKKPKSYKILLHLAVWLILFALPVIFYPGNMASFDIIFRLNWFFLFFAGVIFYLNYFFLVKLLVFDKKLHWFILINLILVASFTFFNNLLLEWRPGDMLLHLPPPNRDGFEGPPPHHDRFFFKPDGKFMFLRNGSTYIIPVIVSLALRVIAQLRKTETEKKEIQNQHLQSELLHLKHQLQPHFLFNSLNNIYALVDISPEKSKEAIHGLAKLIRYLLYETNSEYVELSKEIDFLKQYIQLMRLRLNENTSVIASFPNDTHNFKVAPLLFLPLIENAFKYGVFATQQSDIIINMKLFHQEIDFITQNSFTREVISEKTESGIGIENLKKRLSLLYPSNYQFTCEQSKGVYTAHLVIKIPTSQNEI